MKLKTLTLIALFPMFASATQLTYKLDLAKSKMDSDTALGLCSLPEEIKMDAQEDLATVVIEETRSWGGKVKIQTIQANGGSMSGGGLQEPYTGDYRTRVALVNIPNQYYKGGIYQRVEVVTYGSKSAPKAFTVDAEILNYRESAEIGEDGLCTGYAYRLK